MPGTHNSELLMSCFLNHVSNGGCYQIVTQVFDQDDWQEISVQASSDMKARTLLTLLKKKGPHAFDAFVHVLKETQPCLAAPLLQESGNRTYSLTRGIR